jgi:hypothetical protein
MQAPCQILEKYESSVLKIPYEISYEIPVLSAGYATYINKNSTLNILKFSFCS